MILYSPGGKSLIIGTSQYVYKVATNFAAAKGLQAEKEAEKRALETIKWGELVMPAKYFTKFIKRSLRGQILTSSNALEALHASFLTVEFQTEASQENKLNSLNESLQIRQEAGISQNIVATLFQAEPFSSIHGDFHRDNIFELNGKLKLIDWSNFRQDFWASYDYLHFLVTDQSFSKELNWRDSLQNLVNDGIIAFENAQRYTLCRCELEITQDKRLNRLSSQRREKYKNIYLQFLRT